MVVVTRLMMRPAVKTANPYSLISLISLIVSLLRLFDAIPGFDIQMNCTFCNRRLSVEEYQQIDVLKVCCNTRSAFCFQCLFDSGIIQQMMRERRVMTCRDCLRNVTGQELVIKRQYVSFGGSMMNRTPERPRGFFNNTRGSTTQYQSARKQPYENPLFFSQRGRYPESRSVRQPFFDNKFRYSDPPTQPSFLASTHYSERNPISHQSQRWLPIIDKPNNKMECQEQEVINSFSGLSLSQPADSYRPPAPRPIQFQRPQPYGQPVIEPYKYIPPPQPQSSIFRREPIGRMVNSVDINDFFKRQPSQFLQKQIQKIQVPQQRPSSVGQDYWSSRKQHSERPQNSERPVSSGFQQLASSLSTRSFKQFNQNRQPLPFFNK